MDIVTPTMMRTYRKHAIVVILIVAIITPPDVISGYLFPFLCTYYVEVVYGFLPRFIRRKLKELSMDNKMSRDKKAGRVQRSTINKDVKNPLVSDLVCAEVLLPDTGNIILPLYPTIITPPALGWW